MIWEKIDINPQDVRGLSERYGIDTLLSSILVRRGITDSSELQFFLEDDTRFLHNPFIFKDMEEVIDRFHLAIDEEEKVLIFGDKDVDGVTSCVILYESLKKSGIDASWQVPTGSDSYGLSIKNVEDAFNNDVSMIITVDCGISAFNSVSRARELGIDVIIIDHHNPRLGQLPDANYIINPKVEGCPYPFKGLAACGVVSKVLWALSLSFIDTLYKSQVCLFNIEIVEEKYLLSAIKLYNLVEKDRIELVFDDDSKQMDKLLQFLSGEQILIFNEHNLKSIIREIFGNSVDFHYLDISNEIYRVIPSLKGYSLEDLVKYSRIKKYKENDFRQIDTIKNLFITYILKRYEANFDLFNNSLDLVALGTVADLMPLTGENRILVKQGLRLLDVTKREGFRALLLKQNLLGRSITSKDISWSLAPIINSAGRMQKANKAVELLLCPDNDQKNKLALEIVALNKERRELSENLWNSLNKDFYEALEEFNGKLIVIYSKDMVKGVTGLIASRALSVFNVPVIILAKEGNQYIGSIRSSGNLNITEVFNRSKGLLIDYGGHNCAGGFSLTDKNYTEFKKVLFYMLKDKTLFTGSSKKDEKFTIDANIPGNYLTPDIISINDKFEPFGEENPPLNFVTKGAKILDINFVGKIEKKHLKLLFEIGDYKWPAVFWNAADKVGTLFSKDDIVDIAYRIERNFYGGNETLQLNIMDLIK